MACPAINDAAYLSSVLAHVDCQALTLGESGYRALAQSGSIAGMLLGTALTLFVALFGYRLLLGETPGARDAVTAVVKVGIVLVLATSWPAFRTLAYDVALRGPAELAGAIGGPSGLPGSDGGLVPRLQLIDDELAELALIGSGRPPDAQVAQSGELSAEQQQAEAQRLQQAAQRRRWDPVRDFSLLGNARLLFLVGTLSAVAAVRLLAGLLLALGPFFALFLLFDRTRGLFEGWIRGLAGAALGALATAIVLGVELALLEPWLAEVLTLRRAEIPTPSVAVELLATTLVFALVLAAVLVSTARVARGFRFPFVQMAAPHGVTARETSQEDGARRQVADPAVAASVTRSRATAVADAVATAQRRETGAAAAGVAGAPGRTPSPRGVGPTEARGPAAVPLGRSFRRRTQARVSALADRRNRTT
jgi:type IV secretion system protein VirB6